MRVESARYAVLRRLAFAMRHELVKHLQPIGMVTEVMERRLRAPAPDLAQVHDGVGKINSFSKAAVASCLDVITWLAPDPGSTVALDAAVDECMQLLRSNFSFRGFQVRNEVKGMAQPVGRAAVRMLLPGALLALSDTTAAPAEIVITATPAEHEVHLLLRVQPIAGDPVPGGDQPYRLLQWAEIDAMAGAEDVQVQRSDAGVQLTFLVLE